MLVKQELETALAEAVGRVDKSLPMELWTGCEKRVGNLLSTAFHGMSTTEVVRYILRQHLCGCMP